jgi:hypothetical protein
MLMKKQRAAIISALIMIYANSCSSGVQLAGNQPVQLQQADKVRSKTIISGIAEFPANNKLKVKATVTEIAANATVALIDPQTKITIASGITDNTGAFTIDPGAEFSPAPYSIYLLEASRRTGEDGKSTVTLGTYVKRTETDTWTSITAPVIKINAATTAISLLTALSPEAAQPADLIEMIVETTFHPYLFITEQLVNEVGALVVTALEQANDPFQVIGLRNGIYQIQQAVPMVEQTLVVSQEMVYKENNQSMSDPFFSYSGAFTFVPGQHVSLVGGVADYPFATGICCIAADDQLVIKINGEVALNYNAGDPPLPSGIDITSYAVPGINTVSVQAFDIGGNYWLNPLSIQVTN